MTELTEKQIASIAARRASRMRRQVESTCRICGNPIYGNIRRMYCSNSCRLKASRAAIRARENASVSPTDGQPTL